ncbi:MAG: YnbE family lipoprotein [Sphingobium sp.]
MSQMCEQQDDRRLSWAGYASGGAAVALALLLGGCITVKAPEKPIEINLNVKVQQEVVVRLQKDAQDLIQNNPELFPQ